MTSELRDAYLRRLGVETEPPSAAALDRLHRAHIERIPWETLWIHTGDRFELDPASSAARIASTGRAGYCYHLNGAFSWLLHSLGYSVHRHVGGVHGPDGIAVSDLTNHLVLTVTGLAAVDAPDHAWYVDVGTGDALHGPIPLRVGPHEDGPFSVSLDSRSDGVVDWQLTNHDRGAFPGLAWQAATTELTAFELRHTELSTSPTSRFVQWAVVQRRDSTGVDALRGISLFRVEHATTVRVIEDPNEYATALGDIFGIALADTTVLADVWAQQHRRHEEWAQRATHG